MSHLFLGFAPFRPLLAVLGLGAVTLCGCAGVESAYGLFNSAKNVTGAYHSFSSVKDLKNAQANFAGYNSVLVLAEIYPREDAENLPMIFGSNMAVYTGSVARTVRAPLQVCQVMTQCAGRVLTLNFKEDAYDRNIVQRLTVGDRIRGKLTFIDSASGRILDEKRAEMGETYASLAQLTSGFIMLSMLKSFPSTSEAEGERIAKELDGIPVVAPQYERVLGMAS